MKSNKFISILVLSFTIIIIGGCNSYYLQDFRCRMISPNSVPNLVNKDEDKKILSTSFMISSNIYETQEFNNGKHSKVNGNNEFIIDTIISTDYWGNTVKKVISSKENAYDYNGNNVSWEMGYVKIGGGLNFDFYENVSLLSQFHFTVKGDSFLGSFLIGASFPFVLKNIGFRLEEGFGVKTADYRADVVGFEDGLIEKKLHDFTITPYYHTTLILNTLYEDLLFNFFIQGSYNYNSISYIEDNITDEQSVNLSSFLLGGGIYFTGKSRKYLFGIDFLFNSDKNIRSVENSVFPLIYCLITKDFVIGK